mmetsp:Transcript_20281/g.30946  ORF Transcript_20281/g.30946 Transcript_20281/m.30946 type:complete len:95 (-) Transcript_20281:9-293(-)
MLLDIFNVLVVFHRPEAEQAAIEQNAVIPRGNFYFGVSTTNETRFEVIFDPTQLDTSSSGSSAGFIGHLPSTTISHNSIYSQARRHAQDATTTK